MNEKKGNKKTDEKESTAKTILEYVISIGIAIVAALLINNFILLNVKVPSGSMENTIMTGDRLFGFRPVSYTHLDVYKRQLQHLAALPYPLLKQYQY